MIHDAHNLFSDAQAITSAAASTNYIDLSQVRDIGTGENLYIVVSVDTAFTDTGSNSTLLVEVETDDNSSFSSNTVGMTVGTFAAVSAAGTRLVGRLPPGGINERYVRLKYTPANGDLSAGAVTAFLCHGIDKQVIYADAVTIS